MLRLYGWTFGVAVTRNVLEPNHIAAKEQVAYVWSVTQNITVRETVRVKILSACVSVKITQIAHQKDRIAAKEQEINV